MFRNPLLETPGLLGGFLENFREFRKALKLKLPEAAKKPSLEEAAVRKHGRFAKGLSVFLHITVIAFLLFAPSFFGGKKQKKELIVSEVVDVGKYKVIFPISAKAAGGGGGGGGNRSKTPASKGKLPRFSLDKQLAPPTTTIKNPDPKLSADPTVIVPPDIGISQPSIPNLGDPVADGKVPSDGTGSGGGIGTGSGGGVGSGTGPGVGPGSGGGFGGGIYQVGGGVSAPVCIWCPDPEYSEEARKAKLTGTVVLWAVVDETGRVRDVRVQKSLGMGLDEAATRAVMNWRFKPSERLGKPVPVQFVIEINFRLF